MIYLNNVILNDKTLPMCFNLSVNAGERVAIIGESGAGKSTLLNLIAGFEFPAQGEIWLNDKIIRVVRLTSVLFLCYFKKITYFPFDCTTKSCLRNKTLFKINRT